MSAPRRQRARSLPLLMLVFALLACSTLSGPQDSPQTVLAPSPTRPVIATPLPPLPTPEDEVTRTPPAEPQPTSGPTLTPPPTRATGDDPDYPATPAALGTPCVDQACAAAAAHFWLDRPVPLGQGFVDYVDRSYPYASTQGGLRESHHGVEFANSSGTPVIAAAAGTVIVAGDDSTVAYGPTTSYYGNLVVIELDRTYLDEPVYNLYGHMRSVSVSVGDEVESGATLGEVGSTGVAIGPHLHFEVRLGHNDYTATRNPELWLRPLVTDGVPLGAVAGRVVDTQGNLLPEVTVVIHPINTVSDHPRNRFVLTYSDASDTINADDLLQENFAIGDVPAGTYQVSVSTTKFYEQTITVSANQITWVTFVVNPPGPRPPTPLPETATVLAATAFAGPPEATPTLDPALVSETPTLEPSP